MNSIRFGLSLAAIAMGVVVLAFAGSKSRAVRDPSLRFLRIPVIPELLYTSFEAAFIAFALAGRVAPSYLLPLSEYVQLCLGLSYVLFMYRLWQANGISLSGYVPIRWFVGLTALNALVFAARYPFPALEPTIQAVNKMLLGGVMLYAGACAVTARAKRAEFYPSTKGGFWMAFFCLAYAPFVGLADMFSLQVPFFDGERPVSLQMFPVRELVVLTLHAVHIEPLYSLIFARPAAPAGTLSLRERDVAALVRRGMTNGEISGELNVSLTTVKTHVRNILRKSGALSRSEFVESDGKIGS